MNAQTLAVIEDILDGCTVEVEQYRRYLTRTCWRVEGDFAFLQRAVPTPASVLDVGAVPPLLMGLMAQQGRQDLAVMDPHVDRFQAFLERRGIAGFQHDLLRDESAGPERQYELVCLCEVLEHLPGDIVQSLEQVSRWVAPGGYLFLTTPNLRSVSGAVAIFLRGSGLASKSSEPIRKQYARARGGYGYFGHIREYTEKEVRNLVEGMGYEHVASKFQVHPRAETLSARVVQVFERALPPFRLFGKYLFRKRA